MAAGRTLSVYRELPGSPYGRNFWGHLNATVCMVAFSTRTAPGGGCGIDRSHGHHLHRKFQRTADGLFERLGWPGVLAVARGYAAGAFGDCCLVGLAGARH